MTGPLKLSHLLKRPRVARWIMEGIHINEAKHWLQAVKDTASELVFDAISNMTESHLPQGIRKEVQEAVIRHKQTSATFNHA